MPTEPKCETCRFFDRYSTTLTGECRRYPPKPPYRDDLHEEPVWPYVEDGYWCGEHQEREEERGE